jgi:HAD superfamily hydrolase (TIGR01509 family)
MIKLIIFDLDGVLIESKDIHYKALNKALEEFNYQPISYKDHISKFDGKSTRTKLTLLNLSEDIDDINSLKQMFTKELLKKHIEPKQYTIDLIVKLKNKGYKIACASNSVRETIDISLEKLGLLHLFDYSISNQDVRQSKPNPEMYLKCMLHFGVGPRETLIIEDSYVGRQGAFNSGAAVCEVNNPDDVVFRRIKSAIRKAEGKKLMWRDEKLNILIPMAGAGSRFANAGYTFPKPLIEVNGKPMIQVVKDNLAMDGQFIFIVNSEHYTKYNLEYMLNAISPNCKIITVNTLTEGAACTTLLAKELIDNDCQLLIANSDQYIDWNSSEFMYSLQGEHVDGGILTFENSHPKWSYAKTKDGFVTTVQEKKVISNEATVGIYHWKKGSDYVKYAEQMITKDIRVNNEFYVAPVYNEAIEDGKKFKTYKVDAMYGLGTPEDLTTFLKKKQ